MKVRVSFDKFYASGESVGQVVTIYPRNICSQWELIDVIVHEALHSAINKVCYTTTKQDHYILKRIMSPEWFD